MKGSILSVAAVFSDCDTLSIEEKGKNGTSESVSSLIDIFVMVPKVLETWGGSDPLALDGGIVIWLTGNNSGTYRW
jgi:hypothetical protein